MNFDPANMILYGVGNPIEALETIGPYVRSVHCKDALWAARPGQEWGREVPLGEGDVGFENYLRTLDRLGYSGPLTIEREIPQEPARQKAEIGRAVTLLSDLRAKSPPDARRGTRGRPSSGKGYVVRFPKGRLSTRQSDPKGQAGPRA